MSLDRLLLRFPPLIRFVVRHAIAGIFLGQAVMLLIIWCNPGGFGELVYGSADKWTALYIMGLAFAVTFGSAWLGIALFLLDAPDGDT